MYNGGENVCAFGLISMNDYTFSIPVFEFLHRYIVALNNRISCIRNIERTKSNEDVNGDSTGLD